MSREHTPYGVMEEFWEIKDVPWLYLPGASQVWAALLKLNRVAGLLAVVPVDVPDRAGDATAGQRVLRPADSAAIIHQI